MTILWRERGGKKKRTVTSVNAALLVNITVAPGHSRVQVLEQSSAPVPAVKASVGCHHTKGDLELLSVPNCSARANCGTVGTQNGCTRLDYCVVATESFSDLPTHSSPRLSQQGFTPVPFSFPLHGCIPSTEPFGSEPSLRLNYTSGQGCTLTCSETVGGAACHFIFTLSDGPHTSAGNRHCYAEDPCALW